MRPPSLYVEGVRKRVYRCYPTMGVHVQRQHGKLEAGAFWAAFDWEANFDSERNHMGVLSDIGAFVTQVLFIYH
jgi:hypothetical protein